MMRVMAAYTLTVRHGARVEREKYDELADALKELRRSAEQVLRDGGLPAVKMLREFEPADRVAARLEISTGGWLRGRSGGVDVMGDGSVVAFRGGMHRTPLEPRHDETPYDTVRRDLERR